MFREPTGGSKRDVMVIHMMSGFSGRLLANTPPMAKVDAVRTIWAFLPEMETGDVDEPDEQATALGIPGRQEKLNLFSASPVCRNGIPGYAGFPHYCLCGRQVLPWYPRNVSKGNLVCRCPSGHSP